MNFSMFSMAMGTFGPMLRTLSQLLDKGAAHVGTKRLEAAGLINSRLAPDMYPLAKQVELACEYAKNAAALLMEKEPPRFEEIDATFVGLKARISKTLDYLQSVPEVAFEGSEDRDIELPLQADMVLQMKGHQFLRDWCLPHFYFHVVTAYDILRHHGVELGKRDYLSHIGSAIRKRGNPAS